MEREGEPNHEGLVLFKKPRDRDRESVLVEGPSPSVCVVGENCREI